MRKQKTWNQRQKIIAALRKVWRYSPMRKAALDRTKTGIKKNRCEGCGTEFHEKLVEVHHMIPMMGSENWDSFIDKLLCPPHHLSVLCEACHKKENAKLKLEKVGVSKRDRKEFS